MAGRFFDEWQVGERITHEIRRTVTESDNVWFCGATYNPAQIHIDAEYCKNTEFGQPLVNSIFTLGLVIGLSIQDTTLGTTVANLGMTDTRFPKPVFAGAPQPQDVQGWLRELGDDEAFALRAFHPAADLQSGIALFRRVRRRA